MVHFQLVKKVMIKIVLFACSPTLLDFTRACEKHGKDLGFFKGWKLELTDCKNTPSLTWADLCHVCQRLEETFESRATDLESTINLDKSNHPHMAWACCLHTVCATFMLPERPCAVNQKLGIQICMKSSNHQHSMFSEEGERDLG